MSSWTSIQLGSFMLKLTVGGLGLMRAMCGSSPWSFSGLLRCCAERRSHPQLSTRLPLCLSPCSFLAKVNRLEIKAARFLTLSCPRLRWASFLKCRALQAVAFPLRYPPYAVVLRFKALATAGVSWWSCASSYRLTWWSRQSNPPPLGHGFNDLAHVFIKPQPPPPKLYNIHFI